MQGQNNMPRSIDPGHKKYNINHHHFTKVYKKYDRILHALHTSNLPHQFIRFSNFNQLTYIADMHINMTTPVLREVYHGPGPTCESTFISHFMIPYGNQNDIKIPTDPDVYIRDMPEMKVFVRYVEKYVSNIPTSPAYGVFISQLIRYVRACSSYGCFILRATRLSNKLLEQGYVKERLKSPLRKLYGRYGYLIKQYEVSLSQMLNGIL